MTFFLYIATMNDLDKILEEIIKEKGGSKEAYRNLMDSIAYHESAGTLDPTIKQGSGGPGRGKYQFEIGRHEGGITAAKRTANYLKSKNKEIPTWLQEVVKGDDLDASTLTGEQQDMLFLGNMRMHPKANLKNVIDGTEPIDEFWANYHWAGLPKHRNKRLQSFKNSMEGYADQILNTAEPIPVSSELQGAPMRQGMFMHGGQMQGGYPDNDLNHYDVGGSHETNPYGGIPQGMGANGKMNTVEQNETSFKINGNKFIFSDRIDTNGKISGKPSINKYLLGGGLNTTDPNKKMKPKEKSDIHEQKGKAFKWILNPVTNERLKSNLETLGKDPNKSESMISEAINNIRKVEVEHTDHDGHTEGEFSGNLIQIHKPGHGKDKVMTHELMHAGGLDTVLTDYIRKQYGSPFTNYTQNLAESKGYTYNPETYKYEKEGEKSYSPLGLMQSNMSPFQFDSNKAMMDYLNKPGKGELYPRFQEMREFLDVKPGDEITDEHIKALQSDRDMQFMFKYYKPEVIKEILNNVASQQNKNLDRYKGFA